MRHLNFDSHPYRSNFFQIRKSKVAHISFRFTSVFFQGLLSFISTILNTYLTGCFLLDSELRGLDNYPVFLLATIDLIVTGPGYLWNFVTHEFILFHPSDITSFISNGIPFYVKIRAKIRPAVATPITQNIDPFWFSCLPQLAMTRVNEYGFGLCSLLLAYERFILICKPTRKPILLSSTRKKKLYAAVSSIIIISIVLDGVHSYIRQKWRCFQAFTLHGQGIMNTSVQYGIPILYSVIPLIFCFRYYWHIARVLFRRERKIGRNLNLLLCFAAICLVWTLSLTAKTGMAVSAFYRAFTSNSVADLMHAPFYYTYGQADCVRLLFSMTSIVDPIILLVCQKDYRSPFIQKVEMVKKKICKIFNSTSSDENIENT